MGVRDVLTLIFCLKRCTTLSGSYLFWNRLQGAPPANNL